MEESVKHLTITLPGEGFYKEKGSKFLAFAYPVTDSSQIRSRIEHLKKTYHDARHHCYAYRIGLNPMQTRAYDDGEPGHSAGDPILGQIKSHGLTNVLIVVVRYFGGTKLGVGGLVHAYKTAANDALDGLPVVEVFEQVRFRIRYSYEQTPTVERLLQSFELYDVERVFEDACQVEAYLRTRDRVAFDRVASEAQIPVEWLSQPADE